MTLWLHSLVNLQLASNKISGTLPTTMGLLTKLTALNLQSNAITGLSTQLFSVPTLTVVNLANNLIAGTAASTALFTAIPAVGTAPASAAALDWTPVAGAPIASGGLATFTGKLAAKAGTFVTGTSYVGAVAAGGDRWWAGWTNYSRN